MPLRFVPWLLAFAMAAACSSDTRDRMNGNGTRDAGDGVDAGTTPVDSGDPGTPDSGSSPVDAGETPIDGGETPVDGGETPIDAGGPGPTVEDYSTFFGGASDEGLRGIATDDAGNVYITGGTASRDMPRATNTFSGGRYDVFVAKFDPTGALLWSTYLGGPGYERAYAIEIDAAGFIYLAGRAGEGFPVTSGAFQTRFGGSTPGQVYPAQDGFVAKLDPQGALVWASYHGAFEPSESGAPVRGLALDGAGNLILGSASLTADYGSTSPTLQGSFLNRHSGAGRNWDVVVSKVSNDGTRVLWSRYLGGTGDEVGVPSVAVGANDSVVVLMPSTSRNGGITTPGAYQANNAGDQDFLITKLAADGSPIFTTFLGGSGVEDLETHNLALTPDDTIIVAATSQSADFPVTAGAYDETYNGGSGGGNNTGDVIVARLSADGSRLEAATFVGGALGDGAEGVVVDQDGDIHMCGTSQSPDFPSTADAFQTRYSGGADDMIYLRLSSDLTTLRYGTLFGGVSGYNVGRAAGIHLGSRSIYFGGETSASLPVFNGEQPNFAGAEDVSLVRFGY